MTHVIQTYTDDHLVEQPAIGLLAALGGQTVAAMEEAFTLGNMLEVTATDVAAK